MFKIAASDPPKCQVPSIAMSTLPLTWGGRNSSIAEKMEVNYPPTLIPVKSLPNAKRPDVE